jgi:hypothetical protein
MIVLGIIAAGGEYRHKTIIPAMLITPSRGALWLHTPVRRLCTGHPLNAWIVMGVQIHQFCTFSDPVIG